jgi:acyl-coenzyme A thioesterase PaaI-like protein
MIDWKRTLQLRLYAWLRTPVVAFLRPVVEQLDDEECRIRIPLSRRAKNPLGSAFLGALTTGADVAGSLTAYAVIARRKRPVSVLFKDMHARFLKKATDDVVFVCRQAADVARAVDETLGDGEKREIPVTVEAFLAKDRAGEPVATFTMTLSVKRSR